MVDNTTGNSYIYDAEGRICAVRSEPVPGTYSMTAYVYDADGNRVAKGALSLWPTNNVCPNLAPSAGVFTPTNSYVLGPSGEQLTETDGNGNWIHSNVYAAGMLISTYDMAPTATPAVHAPAVHFQLEDWLGSRRVQTDIAGNTEETFSNLPFGDGLITTPASGAPPTADDATEHHFTGKERDAESGNDYFGARYFASTMGRMLSPDPIGGDLTDPQSLNKYAYALNNPLRFTDPTGLYVCKDSKDCSSKADIAFGKALDSLRGSSNADVARAAAAYGTVNSDNGVTVGFADLTKKGENGNTVSTIGVDPNDSSGKTLRANSDVTINSKISGDDLAATVGHEGSHAADAQDVVKSGLTESGDAIHAGMNITPYQSEQRAYGVTNVILSSENQSRKFACGMSTCTLRVGSGMPAQLPGVIDQIVAHDAVYNQGGKPMSSTNQGASVVNGVTPTPPKATVPH
jgi:RHS repeat-associated protein